MPPVNLRWKLLLLLSRLLRLLNLIVLCTPIWANATDVLPLDAGGRALGWEVATEADVRRLLSERVIEPTEFFGLAAYYNGLSFYRVDEHSAKRIADGEQLALAAGQWFAAVGRFNVLVVRSPGAEIEVGDGVFRITAMAPASAGQIAAIVTKQNLAALAPELDRLRYAHLGFGFGSLARAAEWLLASIHRLGVGNWAVVVMIFAVLVKVLMFPLAVLSMRSQAASERITADLAPRLAEIRRNHSGEEAHLLLVAAHKARGVSLFYTLKPFMATMIQIPFLVAIFNALGEMPQFAGARFLWINDLAYPDAVAPLPAVLPFLGGTLNLLPIIMTILTVVESKLVPSARASAVSAKSQRRNLYFMALAFFLLFFPFPAVMVLYWTLSSVLQTALQSKFEQLQAATA